MLKITILGASGMLGASLFRYFSNKNYLVTGSIRNLKTKEKLLQLKGFNGSLTSDINANCIESIKKYIEQENPDYILNCIGVIKQKEDSIDRKTEININSLLPHQLAAIADKVNAKLIHFSTDCVFSGKKGNYLESDFADADDIYGRSKWLGEIDYGHHLTLRTSIIGHELWSNNSLINWFLSQNEKVNGFNNAIFSGLPTCYVAKVVENIITDYPDLQGLYHLSVDPIDKYTLLEKVKNTYKKDITIHKYPDFKIDRSLNSKKLQNLIKFTPPTWDYLIQLMHEEYLTYFKRMNE